MKILCTLITIVDPELQENDKVEDEGANRAGEPRRVDEEVVSGLVLDEDGNDVCEVPETSK